MTCRRLVNYARQNDLPFLCIHAGPRTELTKDGSVAHLSLKRSAVAIKMDEDLAYDPLFQRHTNRVLRQLLDFKPDVLHITGLNDVSIIGAYLAWKLQLPLLGSWHTNIHEFAASRIKRLLRSFPEGFASGVSGFAERSIFQGSTLYYRLPKMILSPNQELVDTLGRKTGRESRIMGRGVDSELFSPAKRTSTDGIFRLGSVGRLRAEKNVRVLVDIEKELLAAGKTDFEFLIVGEGSEREYLEKNLKHAVFTGFLEGEALAEAYANMDVFIFSSETDTFGNVAQEANSSGVPVIVSNKGGPKFIINDGVTGFIARESSDYAKYSLLLYDDRKKLAEMKLNSRNNALSRSWDSIFTSVYDAYHETIRIEKATKAEDAAKRNG